MKRRLLNLVNALSLLLSVAVGVLWVRSFWVSDLLEYAGVSAAQASASCTTLYVHVGEGSICAELSEQRLQLTPSGRQRLSWHTRRGWSRQTGQSYPASSRITSARFGFGYSRARHVTGEDSYQCRSIAFPFWLCVMFFAVLPVSAAVARVRTTRRAGLCPSCGYDLTCNASGVCPECGNPAGDGGPGDPPRV